jgi:hypothetical protein
MIGNSSVINAWNIILKNLRALNIEDIIKYTKQMAHLTIRDCTFMKARQIRQTIIISTNYKWNE